MSDKRFVDCFGFFFQTRKDYENNQGAWVQDCEMISCSDRRFAVIGWLLSCVIGIDQHITGERVPLTDSDLIQFSPVILNPEVTDDPTPTRITLRLDVSIEFLFTKAVGVGSGISAMAVFGFWVTVNDKYIRYEKEKKEKKKSSDYYGDLRLVGKHLCPVCSIGEGRLVE